MKLVEYTLKLKDMAGGTLGRFISQLQSATTEAEKLAGVHAKTAKSISGGFGNLVKGGLLLGGVVSAARKAGELFSSSIQESLDRQQLQVSFDVLTGSKEAGQKLSKQLIDLQKNTVLGSEVFRNARTMLGFGFKNDEVLANMRMLGDVSMGDTERFNALTLAYSQVRAAGRLMGQDLLQLVNAGFNPLEQMSKRTGKSIGQLKDEMAEGKISFQDVQQAFVDATSEGGRFNNMLETIAQTDAGMRTQLEGAWKETKIKIGDALQPLNRIWMEVASKALPVIEHIAGVAGGGIRKIIEWSQPLVAYTDVLGELFRTKIYPFIRLTGSVIGGMVKDFIQFIAQSTLLKDIFVVIGKVVGWVYDLLGWVVRQMKVFWDTFIMPLLAAVEQVWRWIKGDKPLQSSRKPQPAAPALDEKNRQGESNALLGQIAANTAANSAAVADANGAVASSAPKVVNIHVGKLFDDIVFQTNTLTESVKDIEQAVLDALSRVLAQGAAQAV